MGKKPKRSRFTRADMLEAGHILSLKKRIEEDTGQEISIIDAVILAEYLDNKKLERETGRTTRKMGRNRIHYIG